MLYPVYVWKEGGTAYGATLPDLPGVNTAADELADLPRMVQEAVELMFDGETVGPAAPTDIDKWREDPAFAGGFWMMVDVDMARLNAKAVRVNISLPEHLLHRIDSTANARHLSRSGFLALAAERELGNAAQ